MTDCIWEVAPEHRLCIFCKVIRCSDRNTPGRFNGRVMGQMRKMEPGDTIKLPIESYNAARSAASVLKRDYGVVYAVNKIGLDIMVTRKNESTI